MLYKKLLILVLIVAAMMIAFRLQRYLRNLINPGRSFQQFLLFLLINSIIVFVLVFMTGFIFIYFKDFFFK
ncbi:MAG: hypothetical protein ABI760_10575 [Ferruginibacter sp.]